MREPRPPSASLLRCATLDGRYVLRTVTGGWLGAYQLRTDAKDTLTKCVRTDTGSRTVVRKP